MPRGITEGAAKVPGKMGLVVEARLDRNVGKRPASGTGGDQTLCVAQPALHQVSVGRNAHDRTKQPQKIVWAQAGGPGDRV